MPRSPRIGVSARFLAPRPGATGTLRRTVQYLDPLMANWVMSRDVVVLMVPSVDRHGLLHRNNMRLRDYVHELDGLVLQGGADIAPETYGEAPMNPEWSGDRIRDRYEIALFEEFVRQGKPVFGICRGCQLINVALGGTLWQDINTQIPQTLLHRDEKRYEHNFHDLRVLPGSWLGSLYPGTDVAHINTIHHQAIKALGEGLVVEAKSDPDDIVEAVRWEGHSFVVGVQWHPEFHRPDDDQLLDPTPILEEFLAEARRRM